jgi:hypothetical protein
MVEDILSASRVRNAEDNVSGVLFHDRKSFFQVLEGARSDVADCVLRISGDTRHRRMQVLFSAPSMTQIFSNWGMARATLPDHRRNLSTFADELHDLPLPDRIVAVDQLCLASVSDTGR